MIGIDVTSLDRIKKMYERFGIKAYKMAVNTKIIGITYNTFLR